MKAKEYARDFLIQLRDILLFAGDIKDNAERASYQDKELSLQVGRLFSNFNKEFKEILATRRIVENKSMSGLESLAREFNDKWNAVAKIVNSAFEEAMQKTLGDSYDGKRTGILKRDGFKKIIDEELFNKKPENTIATP